MNLFLKRLVILLAILAAGIFVYSYLNGGIFKKPLSPKDTVEFKLNDLELEVFYNRPSKRNRDIFGGLVAYNQVWRTGANEAAELTLYTDMKLGDTSIKTGVYTFYTIPGDKEWTVIISKDLNVWGSYFYNESNDVARFSVPVSSGDSLEAFSIAFEEAEGGVHMHLGWGTTRIAVPFTK